MPQIDTRIQQLDVLPLTKYYMEQLNLYALFDKYIPNSNGLDVNPAQVLWGLVKLEGICVTVQELFDWPQTPQ